MSRLLQFLAGLRSLQLRFMLIVFAGATLFALLAGTVAYQLAHNRQLASSHKMLEGLALAVDKTLAIGVFASDAVLLREVTHGLTRNPIIARVDVRNMQGRQLASSQPALQAGAPQPQEGMSIQLPLHSPFDPAEQIGELRLWGDRPLIDAAANREAYTLAALMASQALLVALLIFGAAARLVSRPIVRLAQELQDMPPGTDKRLAMPTLHQRDEIGVLIRGANELLEANALALQRERTLRAEVELMESQYRQIFNSSSAGIFVLDPCGRLINGNPMVSKVVGLSLKQIRELPRDAFIASVFARPEQIQDMIEKSRDLGETISGDLELLQKGQENRWVHCLISVQGGAMDTGAATDAGSMVEGVIYDITERKNTEIAVHYRSEHDALTGLKNRSACNAAVDRFLVEGLANGTPVSLLCIDLDGFKQVNDTLGHHAGDQVLIACAERMKQSVRRASDVIGRFGGDEFLVVLPGVGAADPVLSLVASALLEALCQPVALDGGEVTRIGVSIGIACLPLHGQDRLSLINAADAALYEVKRGGKNSFAIATVPQS